MNINQVWPEWQEDCVLGEGSFGKVYRAKRVEYGRVFYSAIKVLTVPKSHQEVKQARTQGMNDSEIYHYFHTLVEDLLNEITLMDNLKGAKNIVGIEDYKIIERQGQIGWDIFIRMELLTPFDSFVSNPEFSQKDVVRLGMDLCSALEICEQNRIVHRDIKPDNIFISRFGEYKLGDFGIARKLEASQANLSRKGTLNYMAPEVYKGQEYGSNVDIYSLGLVLYTLLNNNRAAFLPDYPQPISYSDNERALSQRLSGQPLPSPCNAGASLAGVILKACAYDPRDRYQSATEFKNALIAEWNQLVQTGSAESIHAAAQEAPADVYRSTNDMTGNGRVVAQDYGEGTTVLSPSWGQSVSSTAGTRSQAVPHAPAPQAAPAAAVFTAAPQTAPKRSNRVFQILSIPVKLLLLIISFMVLGSVGDMPLEIVMGLGALGTAASLLLSGRNRYAAALCAMTLAVGPGIEGYLSLFSDIRYTLPVEGFLYLAMALLLFIGGVVMFSQKQVRFGGTLCGYAFAAEWLLRLYQMVNDAYTPHSGHIMVSLAALTLLVWAYGYSEDDSLKGFKLVMFILSLLCAALMVMLVGLIVFTAIMMSYF